MLVLLAAGCSPPDLSPIGEGVGTAAAVGWSAAVVAESDAACVVREQACDGSDCTGTATIDLDDPDCAFPLGDRTSGVIQAAGIWGESESVFGFDFRNVDVDGGSLFGQTVAAVGVQNDDGALTVGYVSQSVGGALDDSAPIDVGQDAWSIAVAMGDRPADAVLTINGGGQSVTATDDDANVAQLAAIATVMDPSCRQNPIDGNVAMEHAQGVNAGITGVSFSEPCDGKAKLDASLSASIGASQKRFDVPLWDTVSLLRR